MPKGFITANDINLALSDYLKTRTETALPHDDFLAGAWAVARLVGTVREDIVPVPVLGEVS